MDSLEFLSWGRTTVKIRLFSFSAGAVQTEWRVYLDFMQVPSKRNGAEWLD